MVLFIKETYVISKGAAHSVLHFMFRQLLIQIVIQALNQCNPSSYHPHKDHKGTHMRKKPCVYSNCSFHNHDTPEIKTLLLKPFNKDALEQHVNSVINL